jgi:hypothetical protein
MKPIKEKFRSEAALDVAIQNNFTAIAFREGHSSPSDNQNCNGVLYLFCSISKRKVLLDFSCEAEMKKAVN